MFLEVSAIEYELSTTSKSWFNRKRIFFRRKLHKQGNTGEVARQAGRHADGSRALTVAGRDDLQKSRQHHVGALVHCGRHVVFGQPLGHLTGSRNAETTGGQRKSLLAGQGVFIQGAENDELNRKFAVVIDKIKNDGFENAAIKYSSSSSSPKGGGLGWIPESEISQNLLESIKKTTIGNITDPIRVPGGLVLFNVENKRHIEKKVDMENELNRLIEVEKEKQLTQFSITYFNLVKNNTIIKSFEWLNQ